MEKIFIEDGNGYFVNIITVQRVADKRVFPPFTCHCKESEINDFK